MTASKRIARMAILLLAMAAIAPSVRAQEAPKPAAAAVSSVPASAVPAAPVPAPMPPPPPPAAATLLPRDLSPWGMFLAADMVVKVVMVGLALASVATWTIWLAKSLELFVARRRLRRGYAAITAARSLGEASEAVGAGRGVARALLLAAEAEWRRSADALDDREGLKERVASHLGRIEAASGRHMTKGTGLLATIGATSPFVGLFGTVWGIMNSFVGLSQAHTTNLAVVAPGIAEALLATACGLVAAVPAVIIYNNFARRISAFKALAGDTAAAVLRLVSRDLSRGLRGDAPNGLGALRAVAE